MLIDIKHRIHVTSLTLQQLLQMMAHELALALVPLQTAVLGSLRFQPLVLR